MLINYTLKLDLNTVLATLKYTNLDGEDWYHKYIVSYPRNALIGIISSSRLRADISRNFTRDSLYKNYTLTGSAIMLRLKGKPENQSDTDLIFEIIFMLLTCCYQTTLVKDATTITVTNYHQSINSGVTS
jgi:hypothetical protein